MLSFNWNNTGVTVELGEIVDAGVDIWAFEYPTPAHTVSYNGKTAPVPFNKQAFEQKIIDHYRFRQIGQETVGRWLHYFRTRIREIMPYYVQLYEFEAKWFNVDDPLESYNLREEYSEQHTGSGTVSGTSSGTTSVTGSGTVAGTSSGTTSVTGEAGRENTGTEKKTATQGNTKKFSNTPQGTITNLDNHLTEATVDNGNASEDITRTEGVTENSSETSETSGTSTQTSEDSETSETSGTSAQTSMDSGTVTHTLSRRGNIGVQPLGTEVKNIREAFINIDLMVINELKDLFIQIY